MTGLRNSFSDGIFRYFITLCFLFAVLPICSACSRLVVRGEVAEKAQPWPQLGRTPQHTNVAPERVVPPLELAWEFKTTAAIGPSIVASDGMLIVSTLDGQIIALDPETGSRLGIKKSRPRYELTSALHLHHLLFAKRFGDPSVVLYDLKTNKNIWKKNPGFVDTEPLIADDRIIIAAADRTLHCYDFFRGEELWTYRAEDIINSSPAAFENLIVFGCDDGRLRALDARTGKLEWQYRSNGAILAPPAIGEGKVFFGSTDEHFFAVSFGSGILQWVFPAQGKILHAPAVDGEVVVFGCNDYSLYCLSSADGAERWRYRAKSIISTSPIISGDVVFFGSLDNYYYAVDLESGEELWKYKTKGRVLTNPIIYDGRLFGASEDKNVYAFRPVSQ